MEIVTALAAAESFTRRSMLAAAAALIIRPAGASPRHRLAFLANSRRAAEPWLKAFRDNLRALGYGDEDIEVVEHYTEGHFDRLLEIAENLVKSAPEVILASSPQAVQALKQATSTIPIIMTATGDPVGLGFVSSLARPGGNITGLSTLSEDMAGKWVGFLKTVTPAAVRIGFLLNPINPAYSVVWPGAERVARELQVELQPVHARSALELDEAFAAIVRTKTDALLCWGDPLFIGMRRTIIDFAATRRLPAIYQFREFAVDGGLMSFGPDLTDLFRRAAGYVDKIFKGAKPADLPVEQPTTFQFVINLKTARALDLTVPPLLLARADEVIE